VDKPSLAECALNANSKRQAYKVMEIGVQEGEEVRVLQETAAEGEVITAKIESDKRELGRQMETVLQEWA
jgi:hypothetical protein